MPPSGPTSQNAARLVRGAGVHGGDAQVVGVVPVSNFAEATVAVALWDLDATRTR